MTTENKPKTLNERLRKLHDALSEAAESGERESVEQYRTIHDLIEERHEIRHQLERIPHDPGASLPSLALNAGIRYHELKETGQKHLDHKERAEKDARESHQILNAIHEALDAVAVVHKDDTLELAQQVARLAKEYQDTFVRTNDSLNQITTSYPDDLVKRADVCVRHFKSLFGAVKTAHTHLDRILGTKEPADKFEALITKVTGFEALCVKASGQDKDVLEKEPPSDSQANGLFQSMLGWEDLGVAGEQPLQRPNAPTVLAHLRAALPLPLPSETELYWILIQTTMTATRMPKQNLEAAIALAQYIIFCGQKLLDKTNEALNAQKDDQ